MRRRFLRSFGMPGPDPAAAAVFVPLSGPVGLCLLHSFRAFCRQIGKNRLSAPVCILIFITLSDPELPEFLFREICLVREKAPAEFIIMRVLLCPLPLQCPLQTFAVLQFDIKRTDDLCPVIIPQLPV